MLYAPNGSVIETQSSIYRRTKQIQPQYLSFRDDLLANRKETAAQNQGYTPAISSSALGGSRPPGMGFVFGDSWARTQRGIMEFSLPVGQVDTINMAMRYACENVFVAKAIKLKTLFTSKGIKNDTGNDDANDFFDSVIRKLYLQRIYRDAVSMYYTAGLVPILLPSQDLPFDWVQLWDPRCVVTERSYGKTSMYLKPDARMRSAISDPEGRTDLRNRDYYLWMPERWRRQLEDDRNGKRALPQIAGDKVLELDPSSYIVIENRYQPFDRNINYFDGCPLQPYFSHCENYRMLMAGDFAAAFLSKNIIALVSIGDPKAEGQLYKRPDTQDIANLVQTFQNPDQAMWVYGDPTHNVRYITPDPKTQTNEKYAESKEALKNLLPGPFWFNEGGGGSFADATVELQALEEETMAAQNDFDEYFWKPIFERAAEGKGRISAKYIKAPVYDRSALRDRAADLAEKSQLYGNGGLDIKSLIAAHGYDPEVVTQKLKDQMDEVNKQTFRPAFEPKQGILASELGFGKGDSGSNKPSGRPKKPGSKKQSESSTGRTPRPSERSK